MDKTKLESFIKWLPINKEEFKSSTPTEVVNRLNSLYETDDGKQTLRSLWTSFEQGETELFRKGGKLDYLLTLSKGGCVSCQKGGSVSVSQDNIQQETSDRNWLTKQINRRTELGQIANLHPTMKLQDGGETRNNAKVDSVANHKWPITPFEWARPGKPVKLPLLPGQTEQRIIQRTYGQFGKFNDIISTRSQGNTERMTDPYRDTVFTRVTSNGGSAPPTRRIFREGSPEYKEYQQRWKDYGVY